MAARTLLQLGNTNKCIFTSVQYGNTKLYTLNAYKQIRGFRRLRSKPQKKDSDITPPSYTEKISVSPSRLWKSLGFTIVFSGTTFVAATILEYERVRKQTYSLLNRYRQYRIHHSGWRRKMEIWWENLTEGQRVFVPICLINAIVHLAWCVPMLHPKMIQYFTMHPLSSKLCWPMLLSTFSHRSFIHLAINMYALHSFSTSAVHALGKEQFLAFYLTSGVMSSFASYLYKAAVGALIPSLGASGAIMGTVAIVCMEYPDIRLSIFFLPNFTFSAGVALKTLFAVDTMGCLLRWRFVDHAAHLGGILFGMFWYTWGNANIWQKREPVLKFWHNYRGQSR